MELLAGPNTNALVKQEGPLGFEVGLPLLAQVASGLQAAHDQGVTHRDVKPANIVLNAAPEPDGTRPDLMAHPELGHPVLVDFGIARLSFVNNFWQYFFPDKMFEKDELLGSVVLSKPPRQRLKLAGGELLTSVQQLFGMLFEDTNIDSHKLATLESAAGEEHLTDLKEAMFMLYVLALHTVTQQNVIRCTLCSRSSRNRLPRSGTRTPWAPSRSVAR